MQLDIKIKNPNNYSTQTWVEDVNKHFSEKDIQLVNRHMKRCLTLCNPLDCGPPGSSIHGILQARTLEWVAISFSRGSSQTRDWTWVSRIVSRCFTIWATREAPLIIREMQIKTIMRYHLTPVQMTIIKKCTSNKGWKVCGAKRTLLNCWWECKLLQPAWRTVRRFFTRLKRQLPYDSEISLPGINPEKTIIYKDKGIPIFSTTLLQQLRYGSKLIVHQQRNG